MKNTSAEQTFAEAEKMFKIKRANDDDETQPLDNTDQITDVI